MTVNLAKADLSSRNLDWVQDACPR